MNALDSFYFSQPTAFLIPTEHLSKAGVSPEFAARIRERRGLSESWIELFNASFSAAYRRVDELFTQATGNWFLARLQNICVATDLERVHPYQRPLSGSAWLVYAADFEPETSSVEFAAYQFVHAERLNTTSNLPDAVIGNLSYFMARSDDELEGFRAGCARSTRPDAVAFRALAQATTWIRDLYHPAIKAPPTFALPEPLIEIGRTGLSANQVVRARVDALVNTVVRGTEQTVKAYYAREAAETDGLTADELTAWISDTAPRLVLADSSGEVVWDPDAPADVEALRKLLEGVPPAPAASLRDDLMAIDAVTARFMDAVDVASLPKPSGELDQSGGTYLHTERGLLAFDVTQQPAWVPLRERTPPYQRLLLAARTAHEWGHLADEANLIGVLPEKQHAHDELCAKLAAAFQAAFDCSPPVLQDYTVRELTQLGRTESTPGEALAAFGLSRLPDLLANHIAKRLVGVEQLEAYVRVNVRTHREERLGPFRLLANFIVEYRYACLSPLADPLSYFLELTGAKRLFVDTGILTFEELEEFFAIVTSLDGLHGIDQNAFAVETP